jgi:integrase
MDLIGERGIDNERVFKYSQSNQETTYFNMWLSQSLPKKRIGQTNEGLTFHSARNSFVTNLLIKGVPPIRVQKYVGHKDLKTTLSYYRGGSEMQEIDIQMYMDDIDAKRSVLKAKDLIS